MEILADGFLPLYITAASGLDVSWKPVGLCLKGSKGRQNAWLTMKGDPGFSKEKMALALGTCEICPVQHDCVIFAIKSLSTYGIYAITKENRKALAKYPDWEERVERARAECRPVSSVLVEIGRDPWAGIQSRPMTPTYGATLAIDGEPLADDAIVIPCGSKSVTAYAWDPERDENVVLAELVRPTYEDDKRGSTITGFDRTSGEKVTWRVAPGRRCRGCH